MLINPIDRASLKAIYTKNGTAIKMVTIDEVECFYSENKGTYLHTLKTEIIY
jgi:DNA-binding LytR/AlgR family response regulator